MTKYCFLILGDDTSFFFIISFSFGFLLCYVIINFYENYFIINFFFSLKLFLFFHVPGYSGMFRNVPAFIDAQNQFPTSETLGELGGGGEGGKLFSRRVKQEPKQESAHRRLLEWGRGIYESRLVN